MVEPVGGETIRVGVSTCLLGQNVRYDGGHKHDRYVAETLAEYFTLVPVCPEVEIGLGVPRENVRLEEQQGEVRMVAPASGTDHTVAMNRFAERRARELARLELCGYILKKGSPSCGMERVRIHGARGAPRRSGMGLFARGLVAEMPLLPVEEEGRLNDSVLRESFIERVFAYHRLRRVFRGRWELGGLVRFHAAEKFLLMAHSPKAVRELGQLVAGGKSRPRAALAAAYQKGFMLALARPAPRHRHVNVLQHIAGYFKRVLDGVEHGELAELIDDFGRGLVPLVVPITMIRHHLRRHDIGFLRGQSYLEPHPRELMLRNHA